MSILWETCKVEKKRAKPSNLNNVMRPSDLLPLHESRREFPRAKLLAAIFRYNRDNVDYREDQSKAEFLDEYRDLMARLRFPLTVYRGFTFDGFDSFFDARTDALADSNELEPHARDEQEALRAACSRLDFARIGTSWTWNRDAAVEGGALERMDGRCHCLVQARIESRQVDWTITLWQNLTVFEEEQEVRLLPNVPIRIVGANPPLWRFPLRANTGPESWDNRNSTLAEINRYLGDRP